MVTYGFGAAGEAGGEVGDAVGAAHGADRGGVAVTVTDAGGLQPLPRPQRPAGPRFNEVRVRYRYIYIWIDIECST